MRPSRQTFFLFLLIVFVGAIVFAWYALPIINGFKAKAACSCVFNSGRTLNDVEAHEFATLPYSVGTVEIDSTHLTATASLGGHTVKTAIYRKGLGCTLINSVSEQQLRQQPYHVPLIKRLPADSIPWPVGNKDAFGSVMQMDQAKLDEAFSYAFSNKKDKEMFGTRAILVVYNGKIIREQFATGFTADMPQTGWSMTKSITNALVGILVKQGRLKVDEKNLYSLWQNDGRKNITVDNLLKANSGLQWDEVYFRPSPATNMLYGRDNMARYAAGFPAMHQPGEVFQYSSGTSNILSAIVRQRAGDDYHSFPYIQLFNKLGMYSAVLEPDASGTFVGSSYCFASARDWARFGLLYLNDGVVNGERILPEGWVKYTRTPSGAAKMGEYGAQFWLNAGEKIDPSNRTYPDVPTDCFFAEGFQGQEVWIIPSKKLVVVRLSLQTGPKMDENKFLAFISDAVK